MKSQLESLTLEMMKGGILYDEGVAEFKKHFILAVLKKCKGNQCKAARMLGKHRNTLSRTIAELHMNADVRPIYEERRRQSEARRYPSHANSVNQYDRRTG